MAKNLRAHEGDLRGINRLTIAGIVGVVDLVEAMHHNIASVPGILAQPNTGRTTGITRLVYGSIRGVIRLVGHGLDRLLAQLEPLLNQRSAWRGREAMLAALNGVLGDYLAASNNPLAITTRLRRGGIALPGERLSLTAAIPQAGGKLIVLLHGLCMNDLQWRRKGHDHGAALARDLGYTAVYLHYNSGVHVSINGRAFAESLETLVQRWPVPLTGLVLIGHSMGGLVARSACHYGMQARMNGCGASTSSFSSAPHTTERHSSAAAIGWTCCWAQVDTRRHWLVSARSAARVSPICASVIWSTRTGGRSIALSEAATFACRC